MAKPKIDMAQALADTKSDVEQPAVAAKPLTGAKAIAGGQKSSRAGQVSIQGWYPNAVKFTLEELRLKRSRELGRKVTSQELMGEAFNELFKKHGFPETAPTKD